VIGVSVLGELEVTGAAGPVAIRALKLRQLLAALVISAGEVRSADSLIDAIWEQSPPASADKLLQVYVSRLRKLLPDEIHIRTSAPGYTLELDGTTLDAVRFERLAFEGRRALLDGNPALAGSLLRRGLSLWRGRAYGELADFAFAVVEAGRLEDLRLIALEDRLDADLATGRHPDVITEVTGLADMHPLRERLQCQAMLCLYRLGRHTEALERFSELRVTLDQNLGLEPGAAARDLQMRILNHDPSLAAPSALTLTSRLPAPTSQLVGREHELDDLEQLLGEEHVRLIVLTGAGGSGKTRLAIEAARRNAHRFANGAAFVPLAPVRDPPRVAGAISDAVGVDGHGGMTPPLLEFLSTLQMLMVIDNVEHLQAAAPLLVSLVEHAPRLTLLVTSRAVLHLTGEHVYPVRPLAPSDAIALFQQRARAANSTFTLSDRHADAVGQICDRLDRLPLAIELAASRTRILSPPELLSRLAPRLPLLTGGVHDLPARQQTMSAAIGWSHDLLDEPARREFRRLAVFAAGCTFDAAQAICDSSLEGVGALLDNNLLQRSATKDGSRYGMLETVREYAMEQLADTGELKEINARHLRYFAAVAERCNLYAEAELPQDFHTANQEQENLRAAIIWARDNDHRNEALQLTVALENFWVTHDPAEGAQLLSELMEADPVLPGGLRARGLRALGGSIQALGDPDMAERHYRESRQAFAALDDEKGIAILDYRLGLTAMERGDIAEGERLLEHSLGRFRAIGSQRGEAQTTGSLGTVARARGDRPTAIRLFERSASMCEQIGRSWWQAVMLAEVAELALAEDDLDLAGARSTRLLELAVHIGDRERTLLGLEYLACAAARTGHPERAGRIYGALETERARQPNRTLIAQDASHLADISTRADPLLEQGRRQGKNLSLAQAIDEALGHRAGAATG
jgi:predicted ATPase/DNA-binding SARP family transcriptional activator